MKQVKRHILIAFMICIASALLLTACAPADFVPPVIEANDNPAQMPEATAESVPAPTSAPPTRPTPKTTPSPTVAPAPEPTATPMPKPTPITMEIEVAKTFIIDIDVDGYDENIVVGDFDVGNGFCKTMLYIKHQGTIGLYEVADWYYVKSAFLYKMQNGDPLLFISYTDCVCDFKYTSLYSFDGTTPVFEYEIRGYIDSIEKKTFTLIRYTDMLGTWQTYTKYMINEDYSLEPITDRIFLSDYRDPLVTTIALPVQLNVDGKYIESTLDIGTEVYPISTDSETYLLFKLADGTEGKIITTWDRDDCTILIDGIDQYDCFDGIEYTG